VDAIVQALYWYLEHIHYILAGAAVFDMLCWIGIFFVYRKVRRNG
jgi:heme/copper-type cytochrome/quinol oxidase subunit 1